MASISGPLSRLSLSLPLLLTLLIALSLPSPSLSQNGHDHGAMHGTVEFDRIVVNLTAAGNFTTFLSYLSDTTYKKALNLTDGINKTLFAPTDAAFAALSSTTKALLANSGVVFQILAYHIVYEYVDQATISSFGNIPPSSLSLPQTSLTSILGTTLSVTVNGTKIKVGNATVVSTNLLADNYTAVHGISSVLIPTSLNLMAIIPVYDTPIMSMSPPSHHNGGSQIGFSSFSVIFCIWVSIFAIAL